MNLVTNSGPKSRVFGLAPKYNYVIKCWFLNSSDSGIPTGYRYWTGSKFVQKLKDPQVKRYTSRFEVYRVFVSVMDNELDKVVRVRRKT